MKPRVESGELLRIFVTEGSRIGGKPLYHAIVEKAREANLAGATVLKAPMGFGARKVIHTLGLLEASTDMPIIIEIVDTEKKIDAFLPMLDEMIDEGMITREVVQVLKYRSRNEP